MNKTNGFVIALRMLLITSFLLLLSLSARASEVTILVNPSVKSVELNTGQLRRIFSMRQTTWTDGQPIRVFVFDSDADAHQALCKQVLQMFPYQIERLWEKLAYSGLGDYPTKVNSRKEMIENLRRYPGSIGYVFSTDTSEGVTPIKVKKD